MNRILILPLLIVLTWVSSAQATSEAECSRIVDRVGMINVHRRWTGTDCFLAVSPYRGPGLVFRNYLITSEGQLMVFNSYGAGSASEDTGARVFFMFPRGATPDVAVIDGTLVAQMATQNLKMSFLPDKGFISGFSAGKVTEDAEISRTNMGGVEIANSGILLLDVGYKQGDSPVSSPTRRSIFYDGFGKSCQVTNKEVFRYWGAGESQFQFTDAQLKEFLAKRCPQLKLTF